MLYHNPADEMVADDPEVCEHPPTSSRLKQAYDTEAPRMINDLDACFRCSQGKARRHFTFSRGRRSNDEEPEGFFGSISSKTHYNNIYLELALIATQGHLN